MHKPMGVGKSLRGRSLLAFSAAINTLKIRSLQFLVYESINKTKKENKRKGFSARIVSRRVALTVAVSS